MSLQSLPTSAQITADGTTKTTVKADGNNFTINQGDRIGDNLFHSFEQFSVPTEGSAAFNNASDIANIFSRVTGSNISSIDGLISAKGAANLFLINPNGIIFGANARLDLGGSFFASSADSLLFDNGLEFSASNPTAPPLIEVNIPVGLGFRDNPGDIVNQSAQDSVGLQVPDGRSLLLVGGDVRLNGGRLTAPGGRISIGGLVDSGTVGLSVDGNKLNLSFPDSVALADVSLSNQARVGGSDLFFNEDGGEIKIFGNRITLDDASFIFSYTFGERDGKGISIRASQLSLEDGSFIRTNVLGGSGKGGNVIIEAEELTLETGAEISTITTFGSGNAGNLSIDAEGLSITDIGELSTTTSSSGDGGNINIRASEIKLSGTTADGGFSSGIFARVNQDAEGNGGNLTIETGRLILQDGAKVSTEVFGEAQGGNLSVTASESIELIGRSAQGLTPSALFARTGGQTVDAKAGDLTIATGKLIITDGAQISASTFGLGDAGDLTVRATNLELSGTSVNGFPRSLSDLGIL
ncbi:MAG: filamentous hemagglutinin N-terminal domain-containing protein [Waterburya sp.]